MQKVIPYFRFEGQALEAASFYAKRFSSGRVRDIVFAPNGGLPRRQEALAGKPFLVEFELEGTTLIANNVGAGDPPEPTAALSVTFDSSWDMLAHDRFLSLWAALAFEGHPLTEPNFDAEDGTCGLVVDRYGYLWSVAWGNMRGVSGTTVAPMLPLPGAGGAGVEAAVKFYGETFASGSADVKYPRTLSCGATARLDLVEVAGSPLIILTDPAHSSGESTSQWASTSPAFLLKCEDHAEMDTVRARLEAVPTGEDRRWCQDRYGVRWLLVRDDFDLPSVGLTSLAGGATPAGGME